MSMEPILSIQNVVKQYTNKLAVDHISLDIPSGKVFGLLGPNGAGKTSLIRIITSITAADSGRVLFQGEPINERTPEKIGYLPEERGLYKKMKVGEQLMYLAILKGLSHREAKDKISYWLNRFDISDWYKKKVGELSKGMQQKIQFIATVLHEPPLLILDEPFSGLDPINTNIIKDEIYRLRNEGTSIVFSTHRMEQVEEVCEEIALINNGQIKLTGSVDDIKQKYKSNIFRVETYAPISDEILNNLHVDYTRYSEQILDISVDSNTEANKLLNQLIQGDVLIKSFNEILPTINEIFIKIVGKATINE